MPEFHLRRKKKVKENRRHTLQDSSEQGQQLQRALEMYQEHNEIILGPNEIVSNAYSKCLANII